MAMDNEEIKRRRLAELSVTLERRPGLPNDNDMRLILNNDGPALASDITFDAEALEQEQHVSLSGSDLPIPSMAPGGDVRFLLTPTDKTPFSFSFTIQWTDESGKRERRATVNRI